MLLVYMFLFYPVRFVSINLGHWPFPDFFTFHDPGFPSIFIPYQPANDFYFSGHTGLCTILMFMFILHFNEKEDYSPRGVSEEIVFSVTNSSRNELLPESDGTLTKNGGLNKFRYKLAVFFGTFLLCLTLYMLTITRIHHFNDLFIAFILQI